MSLQIHRAQYPIKEGCWRHEISQGMAPKTGGATIARSAAAAQLRQQPDDLKIEPDQRHQQAECRIPLHVLRKAVPGPLLDEVKIQHQVQRRDHDDEQADADTKRAAIMKKRKGDTEEHKDKAG